MTKLNFDRMKQAQRLAQDRAKAPDPRFDDLAKMAKLEFSEAELLAGLNIPIMPKEEDNGVVFPEIKVTVMSISPELAQRWLEGNVHNRPIRQRDIDQWARAMKDDRWLLNGESIIFATDGTLMDGQHRLWACVESGTSFHSVVVFGVPKKAFTTIDQGRRRSAADHLKTAGVEATYLTNVGAVAADIIRYRTNSIFSIVGRDNPEQIVALVTSEPDIVEWSNKAKRAPKGGLRSFAGPIAVTLFLGSRGMPVEAENFFQDWITGTDLSAGNPVLALRQRVLTSKPPAKRWERLYLVVSAWNAYAQKRPVYKMGMMRTDRFPLVVGDLP